MNMRRRTISTIVPTVAVVLVFALSASAKGPGSATLDGPGIEEPIQFLQRGGWTQSHESDAAVEMLRMTGLWYGSGAESLQPPTRDLGPAHEVSWGDPAGPAGFIVQYLYLDAPRGPLIHTPEQDGLDGWGPDVIGWFPAPEGLEEAIDEVVVWGQPETSTPAWFLPVIAFTAISGLVGLGSRLSPP
jgi:hypothetical protein